MLYFELSSVDGLPTGKHSGKPETLQTKNAMLQLPDDTDIELLYTLTEHYRANHSIQNACPFCVQCSKLGYTDKRANLTE